MGLKEGQGRSEKKREIPALLGDQQASMDNQHGRWQDLMWLGVGEDKQEGYTGCSKTEHDPDINQLCLDLPHFIPDDESCMVL